MPTNSSVPEYFDQPGTEGGVPQSADRLITDDIRENVEESIERYGKGKPHRVRIRAKIIHDQDTEDPPALGEPG